MDLFLTKIKMNHIYMYIYMLDIYKISTAN